MEQYGQDVVDKLLRHYYDPRYPQNVVQWYLLGESESHLRDLGHADALDVVTRAVEHAYAGVPRNPGNSIRTDGLNKNE